MKTKETKMSERNLFDDIRIGDIVIIPGSGPNWRVVPAKPDDGIDVCLAPGVVINEGFYYASGEKILCLEQETTGDSHELTKGTKIKQAYLVEE